MSTTTAPSLTPPQQRVLAEMPAPSFKTARTYTALVERHLVVRHDKEYVRTDDGEAILATLQATGDEVEPNGNGNGHVALVPDEPEVKADEPEAPVEPEAAATPEPEAEKPQPAAKQGKNPNTPGPGLVRTCKYRDHAGANPLPFEDGEHFPLRKGGDRAGQAVGWCHGCCKKYREAKKTGSFVPLSGGGEAVPVEPLPEPVNLSEVAAGL